MSDAGLAPLFSEFAPPIRAQSPLRKAITAAYLRPEPACVSALLDRPALPAHVTHAAAETATRLITALRSKRKGSGY